MLTVLIRNMPRCPSLPTGQTNFTHCEPCLNLTEMLWNRNLHSRMISFIPHYYLKMLCRADRDTFQCLLCIDVCIVIKPLQWVSSAWSTVNVRDFRESKWGGELAGVRERGKCNEKGRFEREHQGQKNKICVCAADVKINPWVMSELGEQTQHKRSLDIDEEKSKVWQEKCSVSPVMPWDPV